MGNVSGHDEASARSDGQFGSGRVGRTESADSVGDSPPKSPRRSRSPALFTPQENVPENLASIKEFESPPSPVSSYSNTFLEEEEYAKEPPAIPPQQHLTVTSTCRPQPPLHRERMGLQVPCRPWSDPQVQICNIAKWTVAT
ncbi:SNF1-related protein kinase regulatory subunit beta-1 [Iris pallida]|uniref:SNF1-related protein kinase regulatory subunit beta-1 n=1 Tax=Iris pallida TaxID=29817 RepID=A0AAX6EF57_IRIPA|nr:SNF1-related protein kinase regulatory subunit beta-1 [Iris pallida]